MFFHMWPMKLIIALEFRTIRQLQKSVKKEAFRNKLYVPESIEAPAQKIRCSQHLLVII